VPLCQEAQRSPPVARLAVWFLSRSPLTKAALLTLVKCLPPWPRTQRAEYNWRAGLLCSQREAPAGLSAGARVARLEVLVGRQAQAAALAERRLSQLGTRARLLGRDLQPALRQVRGQIRHGLAHEHAG